MGTPSFERPARLAVRAASAMAFLPDIWANLPAAAGGLDGGVGPRGLTQVQPFAAPVTPSEICSARARNNDT